MVANIFFQGSYEDTINYPEKRVTIMKRPYGKRRNPKRRKFIKIYLGGSVTDCGATEKVAFSREKMILLQTSQTFLKKKSYTHLPKYHNMHSPSLRRRGLGICISCMRENTLAGTDFFSSDDLEPNSDKKVIGIVHTNKIVVIWMIGKKNVHSNS